MYLALLNGQKPGEVYSYSPGPPAQEGEAIELAWAGPREQRTGVSDPPILAPQRAKHRKEGGGSKRQDKASPLSFLGGNVTSRGNFLSFP